MTARHVKSVRPAPLLVPQRTVVASAPMRISFAGGGSDVPPLPKGGGHVVGSAISMRVQAHVEPFDPGWVRLELGSGKTATRRSTERASKEISFRLLEAALTASHVTDGVFIRVETPVAPGAGLGGSAAAAVAILSALSASCNENDALINIAKNAIRLEREGLAHACGSQDQVFAALGGMLDIRFFEEGELYAKPLQCHSDILSSFEAGLLLFDTNVRRVSGDILSQRPAGDPALAMQTLVQSASDAASAFERGSLEDVLIAMRRGADAKSRRRPMANYLANAIAERLYEQGARVVRLCGAGGGGHLLVWAPPEAHASIIEQMQGYTVRRISLCEPGLRVEN